MNGGEPKDMHDVPSRLRRLTIDEALLIQTFPSNYVFVGKNSSIWRQIGNAVPCKLAQAVAAGVLDVLTGKTINVQKSQTELSLNS
ncbi:DNA cytosine methyltransferase [Escherichia coli]|nr:DNA cytosine methyltransferase [Escherichia coli]MCW7146425.1 DNA cytosine methyltransferase [Escherichia coli]